MSTDSKSFLGRIPSSNILSEAGDGASSVTELMSRNPLNLSDAEIDRMIEALWDLRERFMAAERSGTGARKAKASLGTSSVLSAKDIGL